MGEGADVLLLIISSQVSAMRESTHSCGSWECLQEASVKEGDLQPAKPLWHEDTRGPRRNYPQNLVITDAAQRMVHFNLQVSTVFCRQYRSFHCWKACPPVPAEMYNWKAGRPMRGQHSLGVVGRPLS